MLLLRAKYLEVISGKVSDYQIQEHNARVLAELTLRAKKQAVPRFKVTRLPGTTIRLSHGRFVKCRKFLCSYGADRRWFF
jgi:hypothetical protein